MPLRGQLWVRGQAYRVDVALFSQLVLKEAECSPLLGSHVSNLRLVGIIALAGRVWGGVPDIQSAVSPAKMSAMPRLAGRRPSTATTYKPAPEPKAAHAEASLTFR